MLFFSLWPHFSPQIVLHILIFKLYTVRFQPSITKVDKTTIGTTLGKKISHACFLKRVSQKQKLDKCVFEEVIEKKEKGYWCPGKFSFYETGKEKINGAL